MNRAVWLDNLIKSRYWWQGLEVGVAQCKTSERLLKLNPYLHMTGVDRKPYVLFEHPRFFYNSSDSSTWGKNLPPGYQFDFIFIDGDHSYEGVMKDIEAFLPHTRFLCGHDFCDKWPGVIKAVRERFINYKLAVDDCWYYEKTS